MRNERKKAVLAFLASRHRPATAGEIAWHIRLPYPARGLYGHLGRYVRWGLLRRWHGPDGRLRFGIAERGRRRLAWLRRSGSR
jgi:hypothetical protein